MAKSKLVWRIGLAAVCACILTVGSITTTAQSGGPDKEKLKKVSFEVVQLGPGTAHALNARGDVVGTTTATDGLRHAFVWTSQKGMTDLGTPGASSYGIAINSAGDVVFETPTGAALSSGGQSRPLDGLYAATDMNDHGEVIGSAGTRFNHNGPGYWSAATGLVRPDVVRGNAAAINANGQVAGNINFFLPILWDARTNVVVTLRDTLCDGGGAGGWAWAINDGGQLAGVCGKTPFRWTDRYGFVALPLPAAENPAGVATAINAAGWVAGTAVDKHGVAEAVLWDPNNQLVELGQPVHGSSIQDVFAINDLNLIVGNYLLDGSYTSHPFLAGDGIGFIDLGENGFQLPVYFRPVVLSQGMVPSLPKPLNNALQIIGSIGGEPVSGTGSTAVLLQPTWEKNNPSR
jgi:probable HAF family extracellular repeat protein